MKTIRLVALLMAVLCNAMSSAMAQAEEGSTIRMALLPIPDVLPVYVALDKGYFTELGITVEPLPVASAVERDQLMQAGRVDGMINEVSGAALFNRETVQMKIVSFARTPMAEAPLFRILAAPGTEAKTPADLAGVAIGVSKNTIIEYLTERLLEQGGVSREDVTTRSVPVLPERFQLLLSGQLPAATLPDPLGYAAMQAGAVEIVNDLALPELSGSVISFSTRALAEKDGAIRSFLRGWDRAAAEINGSPETYRQILLKHIRMPKNVATSYPIPPLPRGEVPTPELWQDVQAWLVAKGLLQQVQPYQEAVTGDYLP